MTEDPWTDLRGVWQSDPGSTDASALVAQLRRAERSRLSGAAARVAVASASIAALIGAILHSVNQVEGWLALAVGLTIAAGWGVAAVLERRQRGLLGGTSENYPAARRRQIRSQLRTHMFVVIVLGLELVFLLPWWAQGIPLHFGGYGSWSAIFAWWLPLAGLIAFLEWSRRRLRILRREARVLEKTTAE
jgi:hypothetical protein